MRQRAIRVQDRLGQSHRSATVPPMSRLPNAVHFCDCSSAAGLVSFGYPDYKSNAGPWSRVNRVPTRGPRPRFAARQKWC